MSQYLLLRDNKQSGPYNLDELTAKGLKAYDLIWIEGKSAAWRYPSEIQELKPFAPVVEEQPYDRFYKRQNTTVKKQQETVGASSASNNIPGTTKSQVESNAQNQATINNTTEPSQPKKSSSTSLPNRRVVVIMPGGMNKEPQRESVFFHETVENKIAQPEKKPVITETRSAQPERQITPTNKEQVAAKKAVPALPLYDDELVEFRKAPVVNSAQRNHRKAAKSKLPKILASTIIMLTICGIIGWAYNYNFTERQTVTPIAIPTETVQLPETHTVFNNEPSAALENVNTAENQLTAEEMLAAENQAAIDSVSLNAEPPGLTVKKPVAKPKKVINAVNQLPQQTEPVTESVQQTRSEIAAANTDNEEAEKKTARRNIAELIRVSKNDFKIGAFGGISNLELKVTNTSPYPVDLVVVEVKYLLANKKEFKTENVYFKNLAPGATATKEAPKSTRGIQVSSKVALITSKALGMYQASL
jgi:hypothetical protein